MKEKLIVAMTAVFAIAIALTLYVSVFVGPCRLWGECWSVFPVNNWQWRVTSETFILGVRTGESSGSSMSYADAQWLAATRGGQKYDTSRLATEKRGHFHMFPAPLADKTL